MRIEKVKIKNIRCWYDEHEYDLCKYTAFIGENSSGKSTLQDIIYYGLLNQEIAESMVSRNTYRDSSISFKISFTESEISNILQILARNMPRDEDLSYLSNAKIDLWNHLILTRNKIQDNSISSNKTLTLVIENQENSKLEKYDKYIERIVKGEISTYQVTIDYIRDALRNCIVSGMKNIIKLPSTRKISSSESVSSKVDFSTSHDGNNIRGLLFNAKNSEDPKMRQKYLKFQEIVQGWSFIPGKPEILAKTGENIDLFFVDKNSNQHKIEEVGDGIKEAIIIAGISILQPDRILLIEEPELHLHPRALRELRELLKHEHKGQVIISTHNPVFINEIDDDTAIFKIIQKTDKSKAIKITDKEGLLEFRKEFALFNSDFLFEDVLVFVEGVTDVSAFTNWFELLYPVDMSIKFVAVGGINEISAAIALSIVLQLEQHFSYYAVVDKDKKTQDQRRKEIVSQLKNKNPHLFKKYGEDEINNRIIVLKKENLEEYFSKVPRIFAEILEANEKEVKGFLEQPNMSMVRKLKRLFMKFGKGQNYHFKKSLHIPLISSSMEKHEIAPEIKNLFDNIREER